MTSLWRRSSSIAANDPKVHATSKELNPKIPVLSCCTTAGMSEKPTLFCWFKLRDEVFNMWFSSAVPTLRKNCMFSSFFLKIWTPRSQTWLAPIFWWTEIQKPHFLVGFLTNQSPRKKNPPNPNTEALIGNGTRGTKHADAFRIVSLTVEQKPRMKPLKGKGFRYFFKKVDSFQRGENPVF